MITLKDVQKVVFNPLLSTEQDIETYLVTSPDCGNGTAHPFNKTLLLRLNNQIHSIDISSHEESFFFNTQDLNALSETIWNRIKKFGSYLTDFDDYTVVSLTEPFLAVDLQTTKPTIFALSERKPTYYDLAIGNDHSDNLCFDHANSTNRRLKGIFHSGDLNSGNDLLHTITFDEDLQDESFAFFVSGYTLKKLSLYAPQNPAVMIADHVAKFLYVVPVPLDEVTIGNSTVVIPVVGRRKHDKIEFDVLPAAIAREAVSAGGPKLKGDALPQAIARGEEIQKRRQATASVTTGQPASQEPVLDTKSEDDNDTLMKDTESSSSTLDANKPLYILEQGCTLPSFVNKAHGNVLTFCQGLTIGQVDDQGDSAVLPCALGNPLEGPLMLALGKPFNGPQLSLADYRALFDKAPATLVCVSEKMTDQARLLNKDSRCNGLFVVQSKEKLKADASQEDIESKLNNLKINAVTALAGPQSIVLCQFGSKFYFYRGVRWAGFFDETPRFGEDVTDLLQGFISWISSKSHLSWPRLVNVDTNPEVYFRSEVYSPKQLFEAFTKLALDQLEEFKDDIKDTFVQLQCILSPKDLADFTTRMQTGLSDKMVATYADLRKEYLQELKARKGLPNKNSKTFETLRKTEKDAKRKTQWLINLLGNTVSNKISSTKNYDLKQMVRKSQIQGNVHAASEMTYESLGEMLEEHASELGVVIGNVNGEPLKKLLTHVSKGTLLHTLQSTDLVDDNVCTLDDRILHLNGLDAGIIFEMCQKYHSGPLCPEKHKVSVAFPKGLSTDGDYGSALAWTCFDEFLDLKTPYHVSWMEETNASHIATLRILQRATIANAVDSRQYNISPSNPELGFFLLHALSDLMLRLTSLRSAPPAVGDASDTTTRMIRGLFGHLMTICASGTNPLSMAWQMASKSQSIDIPEEKTWWLYSRIIKLFPYTAWPQNQFKSNICAIIARTVRRKIADKATEPIRANLAKIESDKLTERTKFANERLSYLEVIVECVRRLFAERESSQLLDESKAIAERLIEVIPKLEVKGQGHERIMRAVERIAIDGDVDKHLNEHTRIMAANIQIKRSNLFASTKTQLYDACVDTAKSHTDRKAALHAMVETLDAFAKTWSLDPSKLHIQNKATITEIKNHVAAKDTTIPGKLIGRLKGDADRRRRPWSVGKTADGYESQHKLIPYVMDGFFNDSLDDPAKNGSGDADGQVAIKQKSLVERISELPGAGLAVKLLNNLEAKITEVKQMLKDSDIPQKDFEIWLEAVGYESEEKKVELMKKMLVVYVEGWRDSVAAEKEVMKLTLKGAKMEDKLAVEA